MMPDQNITSIYMESPPRIAAADHPDKLQRWEDNTDKDASYSFEFSFITSNPGAAITAGEIFSDGWILLVSDHCLLPIRNRATKSVSDKLEVLPECTYCTWAPGSGLDRCRKSCSSGWRRFRDLVIKRCYSDTVKAEPAVKKGATAEMDVINIHRLYYAKGGNGQRGGSGRTCLTGKSS